MFQDVMPLFQSHTDRMRLDEGDRLRIPVPQELHERLSEDKGMRLRLQFLPAFSLNKRHRHQPDQFLLNTSNNVRTIYEDEPASTMVKIYEVSNSDTNYQLTETRSGNQNLDDLSNIDKTWFFHEWDYNPAVTTAPGKFFRTLDDSGWYVIDALVDANPQDPSEGKRWRYLSSLVVEGSPPPINVSATTSGGAVTSRTVRDRYSYQYVLLKRRDIVVSCTPFLDYAKPGSLLSDSSYSCTLYNRGRGPWDKVEMRMLSNLLFHIDRTTAEGKVEWDTILEERFSHRTRVSAYTKQRIRALLLYLTGRDIKENQVLGDTAFDTSSTALRYATASGNAPWEKDNAPWKNLNNFDEVADRFTKFANQKVNDARPVVAAFVNETNINVGRGKVDALPSPYKSEVLAIIDDPTRTDKGDIDDELNAWLEKVRKRNQVIVDEAVEVLRYGISTLSRSKYVWTLSHHSASNAVMVPKQLLSPNTELVFEKYRSRNSPVPDKELVRISLNQNVTQTALESGDGKSSLLLNPSIYDHKNWIKVTDQDSFDLRDIEQVEAAINHALNNSITTQLASRTTKTPVLPNVPSVIRQLHESRGIYLSVDKRSDAVVRTDLNPDDKATGSPYPPNAVTYPLLPLRATQLIRWAYDTEDLGEVPLGFTLTIDARDLIPDTVNRIVWQLATPRSNPSRYAYNARFCAEGSRAIVVRPVETSDYGEYVLTVTVNAGQPSYSTRFRLRHIPDANCLVASKPIGFVARQMAKHYGKVNADAFAYEQPHRYRYARDLDNIVRYYRLDQQPYGSAPFSLLYHDLRYIPGVDHDLAPPYLRYHPPTTVLEDQERQFVVFNPIRGRWEFFQLAKNARPLSQLKEALEHYIRSTLTPLVSTSISGKTVTLIGVNIQDLTATAPVTADTSQEKTAIQRTIGALVIDYFDQAGNRQRKGINDSIDASADASADPYTGLPATLAGLAETVPGIRAPEKMLPPVRGATRVQSFATWIEDRSNAFELYLEAENSLVDLSARGSIATVLTSEVPVALLLVWLDKWAALYRQQNRVTRANLLESIYRQMTRNFESLMSRVDRSALMEAASVRGSARFESDQLFWLPYSDRLPQAVKDALYIYSGVNAIDAYERLDAQAKAGWSENRISLLRSLGVNRDETEASRFFSRDKQGRRLFTDFALWQNTVTINDLLMAGARLLTGSSNVSQRRTINVLSAPYPERRISLYASNPAFSPIESIQRTTLLEYRASDDDGLERALRFFEIEVPQDPSYCDAMDDAVESYRRTQPVYYEPSDDSLAAIAANKANAGDHSASFDANYAQSITAVRPDGYDWNAAANTLTTALPENRRAKDSTGSVLGVYQSEKSRPVDGTVAYHPGEALDDPTGLPVPTAMPSSASSSQAVNVMLAAPSSGDLRSSLLDALKAEYASELLQVDAEKMLGSAAISTAEGIPQALINALIAAYAPASPLAAPTVALVAVAPDANPNLADPARDLGAIGREKAPADAALAAIRAVYDPVLAREAQLSQPQRAVFLPIKAEVDALEKAIAIADARMRGDAAEAALQDIEGKKPKPPDYEDNVSLQTMMKDPEPAPYDVSELNNLVIRLASIENYENKQEYRDFAAALADPANQAALVNLPAATQVARLVPMEERLQMLNDAIAFAKTNGPQYAQMRDDARDAQAQFTRDVAETTKLITDGADINQKINKTPKNDAASVPVFTAQITALNALKPLLGEQLKAMGETNADLLKPADAATLPGESARIRTALAAIDASIEKAEEKRAETVENVSKNASEDVKKAAKNLDDSVIKVLETQTQVIQAKLEIFENVEINPSDKSEFEKAKQELEEVMKEDKIPSDTDVNDLISALNEKVKDTNNKPNQTASENLGKITIANLDGKREIYDEEVEKANKKITEREKAMDEASQHATDVDDLITKTDGEITTLTARVGKIDQALQGIAGDPLVLEEQGLLAQAIANIEAVAKTDDIPVYRDKGAIIQVLGNRSRDLQDLNAAYATALANDLDAKRKEFEEEVKNLDDKVTDANAQIAAAEKAVKDAELAAAGNLAENYNQYIKTPMIALRVRIEDSLEMDTKNKWVEYAQLEKEQDAREELDKIIDKAVDDRKNIMDNFNNKLKREEKLLKDDKENWTEDVKKIIVPIQNEINKIIEDQNNLMADALAKIYKINRTDFSKSSFSTMTFDEVRIAVTEKKQQEADEAERQRLEAERQRLAAEAERQRLAAEEAERQRLAAEEAERQRDEKRKTLLATVEIANNLASELSSDLVKIDADFTEEGLEAFRSRETQYDELKDEVDEVINAEKDIINLEEKQEFQNRFKNYKIQINESFNVYLQRKAEQKTKQLTDDDGDDEVQGKAEQKTKQLAGDDGAASSSSSSSPSPSPSSSSSSSSSSSALSPVEYTITARHALVSKEQKWVNSLYPTTIDGNKRTKANWENNNILRSVYGTTKTITNDIAQAILSNPTTSITFKGVRVNGVYYYNATTGTFVEPTEQTKIEIEPNAYEQAVLILGMIDPERAPFKDNYFQGDDPVFKKLNPNPTQPKLVVLGVSKETTGDVRIGKDGTFVDSPKKKTIPLFKVREGIDATLYLLLIPPYENRITGFQLKDFKIIDDGGECVKLPGSTEPVCDVKENIHRPFHAMYTKDEVWKDIETRQKSRIALTPNALNPTIDSEVDSKVVVEVDGKEIIEYTKLSYPHATLIDQRSIVSGRVGRTSSMYFGTEGLPGREFSFSENKPTSNASIMYVATPTKNGITITPTKYKKIGETNTPVYMKDNSILIASSAYSDKLGVLLNVNKPDLTAYVDTNAAFLSNVINLTGVKRYNTVVKKLKTTLKVIPFVGSPDGTVSIDQPDSLTQLMIDGKIKTTDFNNTPNERSNLRDQDAGESEDKIPTWLASQIDSDPSALAASSSGSTSDLISFESPSESETPAPADSSAVSSALNDFAALFGFGQQ